jgi:Ca2+-binding EF-hand superfamily protein
MLRAVAFIGVLLVSPTVVAAQAPCTTDARRIVDEIYRHMLERAPDPGSAGHVERLAGGSATVRDLVRLVAKSPEHTQRFFSPGQGRDEREQAVGTLYRHLLGRQPDPAGARGFAELAVTRGVGAVIDDILASPEYQQSFGDNGVPGSGGLRYCGSERPQSTQAGRQVDEMRFRGMDRNNDGVIARSEWRGTAESFRVHDWNRDGVLSGDEVRAGAERTDRRFEQQDFDPAVDDEFPSWSEAGFSNIDRNRDGRITSNEWHYDLETFRRVDRNRDGTLSRAEFLATSVDDDRDDRFEYLDVNRNGRIERDEWHGSHEAFDSLDRNNDDTLTRAEVGGNAGGQRDRFATLDVNRSGTISLDEWRWSRRSFDEQDVNRDGVLTRREFNGGGVPTSGRN